MLLKQVGIRGGEKARKVKRERKPSSQLTCTLRHLDRQNKEKTLLIYKVSKYRGKGKVCAQMQNWLKH